MNLRLRYLLPLTFGLLAAGIPALAAQTGSVQCEVNEERVWVYDSLANLNVEAKLNCGDTVEILGQVKGYVMIRTPVGRVGYIPKDALPNLPVAGTNEANPAADQPVSLAEAAMRARRELEKPREQNATPNPLSAGEIPANPAPVTVTPSPATQVAYAAAGQPVRSRRPISNRADTTPAATVSVSGNSIAASSVAASAPRPPAPRAAAEPSTDIVLTTAANDTPEVRVAEVNPETVMSPAANITPPAAAKTMQPASGAAPAPVVPVQPVAERAPAIPAPPTRPAAISVPTAAPTPTEVAASSPAIPANVTQPAPTTSTDPRAHHSKSSDSSMDEEEGAEASLNAAETSRQNCTAYFSAYGLTPNQFKWLMIHRKKQFPWICPASLPSLVDYVIIFTHDVNFYNYTMPAPVRVDASGMSDWTPLRTVDTAFVSPSNADKNHREFVWVFHVRRGTFNPAQFSSRRRPQYAKNESNMFGSRASDKTVEDALRFIEENGTSR